MDIFLWIAIFTIVRVTDSETVDDKDKLRTDLSHIKDQLNGMQGSTDELKESIDAFSNGLDNFLNKDDAADVYNRRLNNAQVVVDGTLKSLPKFKSGDPAQVISGVLDMTSMALTTFGGRPFHYSVTSKTDHWVGESHLRCMIKMNLLS